MHRRHAAALILLVVVSIAAAGCGGSSESAKRKYVTSGDDYFKRHLWAEAIVQYRNAAKAAPRDGEIHLRLAEAYERNRDLRSSYEERLRAAALLPNRPDVQIAAGRLFLAAGRYDEAKARAEQALAKLPRSVDALILLGNAMAGMKDLDGAIAEIEQAARSAPGESRLYAALGVLRLARGQRDLAEKSFRRAVEVDPASVEAKLALARFYWAVSRPGDAEQQMKLALSGSPNNVVANRAMAAFLVASGRATEAQVYLEKAASIARDVSSSLALADYYARTGQGQKAVPVIAAVSAAPALSIQAKAQIAAIQHEMGKTAEAYRAIDSLIKKAPGASAPLLVKARLLAADGKPDDAVELARRAAAIDPGSIDAYIVVARLSASIGRYDAAVAALDQVLKLDPQNVAAQLDLARLHLAMGQTNASLPLSERAVRDLPSSPDAHLVLAEVLIANGDLLRAQRELDALAARYPNAAAVQVQLGSLALARDRADVARKAFEKALILDSGSLDALNGLVNVDLRQKNPRQVRARIEARLAKAPNDIPTLMVAANAYASLQDLAASERMLLRVLRVDANLLPAYSMLARIYLSQQRLDAARNRYEEIVRRDPRPVAAETMIGIILQAQNRHQEAQKRFERALKIDPRAAVAANNLAWIYVQNGVNLDRALELAQIARDQLPGRPEVNDTLGWIYLKKGLANLAVGPLERSVELQPGNPTYRYHLGIVYMKTAQSAKARRLLEEALRLQPNFEGAADAKRALLSIGPAPKPAARGPKS